MIKASSNGKVKDATRSELKSIAQNAYDASTKGARSVIERMKELETQIQQDFN